MAKCSLEIPLAHRGDRVFAHHGMTVKPVSLVTIYRKVITENDITAKQGHPLDNDPVVGIHHLEGNVGGMPEGADRC